MKNSLDNAEEKGVAKGLAKGLAEGRAEGLAKGRAEGEQNKAVEIAAKLLEMGMPIDSIINATGLSVEEIQKL